MEWFEEVFVVAPAPDAPAWKSITGCNHHTTIMILLCICSPTAWLSLAPSDSCERLPWWRNPFRILANDYHGGEILSLSSLLLFLCHGTQQSLFLEKMDSPSDTSSRILYVRNFFIFYQMSHVASSLTGGLFLWQSIWHESEQCAKCWQQQTNVVLIWMATLQSFSFIWPCHLMTIVAF